MTSAENENSAQKKNLDQDLLWILVFFDSHRLKFAHRHSLKFLAQSADLTSMNIKGLINSTINTSTGVKPSTAAQKTDRAIKSENTQERDANGQEFYSKTKKKQRMTKEQFDRALALLNQKSFMTEMKWQAYEVVENQFFYAEVKSDDGVVIRRMSEFDMWELFEETSVDENKGQLLKKTA